MTTAARRGAVVGALGVLGVAAAALAAARPDTPLVVATPAGVVAASRPDTPLVAAAPAGVVAATAPRRASASNVAAADYVGPAVCGECHGDQHAAWQAGSHAVMNRRADAPGAVVGDFADAVVRYGGGQARFRRTAAGPVMELTDASATVRRYRVTRTIGTRFLQEYVGVLDGGDGTEVRLPLGWWLARPGWYPQPFFDSWFTAERDATGALAFDPFVADPTPWATRCAWCHNTYPFALRLARARGSALGHGLEQFVVERGPRDPSLDHLAADNLLPTAALVTVGISCESCHLGGRAHADGAPISFTPTGAAVAPAPGAPELSAGRRSPLVVGAICGQCHSTPSPRFADGAPARNSSEALALAAGACTSRIRCTDCHDPHRAGGPGDLREADAVAACTGCHAELATASAAARHGRHRVDEASCLDCHMPRIVQGRGDFVRSHRISAPGDPMMLAADAPNACNLCHRERSLAWTVAELAAWGVRPGADALARARAEGDQPLGLAWLDSSGPVRLVAALAYARAGDRRALPALLARLDDPVAFDRLWLVVAVERLLGRRLGPGEYDPLAEPAVRTGQAARLGRARRD